MTLLHRWFLYFFFLAGLGTGRSLLSNSAATNGNAAHLQQQQTPSILRGISTNVGDVIKASGGISTSSSSSSARGLSSLSAAAGSLNYPGSVTSGSAPYSAPQHSSIFSSGLQNDVSRSLNSNMNNNSSSKADKPGVILPGVVPPAGQRPKPARSKAPPTSSKIPESAVEMPEDAMGSLNLQLSGLKFGTEGFDFIPEPNKSTPSVMPLSAADTSYPPPSVTSSSFANSSPYAPIVEASAAAVAAAAAASTPAYGNSVAAAAAAAAAAGSVAPPSVSAVPSSYSNSSYPYAASASLSSYSNPPHPSSGYNASLASGLERNDVSSASAVKQTQKVGNHFLFRSSFSIVVLLKVNSEVLVSIVIVLLLTGIPIIHLINAT